MEDPGAPRQGRPAGRHRPRKWYLAPGVHRQVVTLAASAVTVALAAAVVLTMLPDHATTVLASKCQPRGCHQVIPLRPRTMVPVVVPASTQPAPTSSASLSATPAATVSATRSPARTTPRLTPGS